MRPLVMGAVALTLFGCQESVDTTGQPYAPYTNLQVLPKNTAWPQLQEAMLANLNGLGLPRSGGRGCLFCHEGSADQPMRTWDFAADTKQEKRIARVMMRMVRSINQEYLHGLQPLDSVPDEVTCVTCHRGRTNPRPILAVLEREYASGGMADVAETYRTLRGAYFGRGVYDLQDGLIDFGVTLADRGDYDNSLRALDLNLEFQPDSPDAHRWLVRIAMERAALASISRDELRAVYDSLASIQRPEDALVWHTLRSVGVRLRNNDRLPEAEAVFTLNEELYPEDARVVTDLAVTRLALGDTAAAVSGARHALELQPDYDVARDLLDEAGAR